MTRTSPFRRLRLGATALTVCLGGALQAHAQGGGGREGGPPPTPVYVDAARLEMVQQQRMITGNLRAPRQSNLATQEAGLVLEVLVREGDAVNAGDVIAQLDSRRLALQIAQAEADVLVERATVLERDAELLQETRDLELMRDAFQRHAANPKELRDAEAAQAIAAARKNAAERRVEAIEALIALWKERFADTVIRAPYSGTVVAKHVDPGEWLDEGQAVVEIVALEAVEVWLEVPQEHLAAVQSAQRPIALRLEATRQMYEATEQRIVPLIDPKARTFMLIATLQNADRSLAPGQSVVAWVPTEEKSEQLTIPKNAALRNQVGSFVYVARESGEGQSKRAHAVPVQVLPLFPIGDRWVIRSDQIRDGEMVVVEGNERLLPMSVIQPLPAPSPEDVVEAAAASDMNDSTMSTGTASP